MDKVCAMCILLFALTELIVLTLTMSCSDEDGDRPRPLPDVPELQQAIDIFERKESPSWDYDVSGVFSRPCMSSLCPMFLLTVLVLQASSIISKFRSFSVQVLWISSCIALKNGLVIKLLKKRLIVSKSISLGIFPQKKLLFSSINPEAQLNI